MNRALTTIGLVAAFAVPKHTAKTERLDPSPTHPAPLRPNPTIPLAQTHRPVPSAPVPPPRPHQHTDRGTQFAPVVAKLPEYTVPLTDPSPHLNAWVLKNFRVARETVAFGKKNDPIEFARIDERAEGFRKVYADRWRAAGEKMRGYFARDEYRYATSRWYADGFYGGYFYPVRLGHDITLDFSYPTVNWFFSGGADTDFYKMSYTVYLPTVFPYASSYFPTETLRDLAVDVGGLNAWKQFAFRDGVTVITDLLRDELTKKACADYAFGDGEIVLSHYENLRNEAYVIEGFVDGDSLHVPFKALVDLDGSSLSAIFAVFESDPAKQDRDLLHWMNDRVLQLGGDPFTAYLEPK